MNNRTSKHKNVTITHPEGASMHFSESISGYLINHKNCNSPFLIGKWIETLSDEELNRLKSLAEVFFTGGGSHSLDDILGVICAAVTAETKRATIEVTPEYVSGWSCSLLIAVSMESYKRRGFVEILTPLSIDPHVDASIRLTESGLKEGIRLKSLH